MPSHSRHKRTSKLLTGNSHDEVHKAIDAPYMVLGRKHRVLFHDPFSAAALGALAALLKDKSPATGAISGLTHIAEDWAQTGANAAVRAAKRGLGLGRKRRRRAKGWFGLLGL